VTQSMTLSPLQGTFHSRDAERREARALFARAVEAFREGLTAAAPPPPPGPTDRQLNEELLAYVYGRLDRSDHASIAKVGSIREHALALGRAGQQQEAEAAMKLARFLLSAAGFSPLGRAAADTLHHAAEAYLSYRRGDFGDAGARMAASVAATDRLADAWGESFFTTARRVHLLHNQMKVEARRGAAREAVVLGAGILAHLAGSSAHAGLPALARPVPALEPSVADSFCEVVGVTLAEIFAAVPDAEARELLGLLADVTPARNRAAARVWAWLPLKSAAFADDPRGFLEGAVPFLRAGRGRAAVLWYAVALDVVRVARRVGAETTADGAAEIEAALGADPRVPKCIQAALGMQDPAKAGP
jgi:hypothetical protein